MLKITQFCLIGFAANLNAADIVTSNSTTVANDQPYYTEEVRNSQLIFTQQNKPHAEHAAAVSKVVHPLFEQTFGYQMDSPLSIGLLSSYNQIANGFSTQFPVNRQMNYIGGGQSVDDFSSTSWLDGLLIHETAHNYQTNTKDNPVSQGLFKVLGNGSLLSPLIPAINPNIFESSFILEGNAVLNESWFGNGGRLYNGRYRAMTNIHAQAGLLTPKRLYNATFNFPYAEGFYIFGSQYQYYLAKTYGLEKVNHYFKQRSRYWFWPFMVNRPMRNTLGINFNQSFADWVYQTQQASTQMTLAQGRQIATSKYFSPMTRQAQTISFLTNPTALRSPLLNQYSIQRGQLKQQKSTLALGKVFTIKNKHYSVSSQKTSVWRVHQGLFNQNRIIRDNSKGKVVQGFMDDGREVYFSTEQSFEQPQLYVGDKFYRQVNSSVLVRNSQLYYFVQQGDRRILYKNRQAIAQFKGYYGIVVDTDADGRVYFIANSEFGSSLYRVNNGAIERVLSADNILDAKLIGNKILVNSVTEDAYRYRIEEPDISQQLPYQVKLMWDEAPQTVPTHTALNQLKSEPLTTQHSYGIFNQLSYNAGYLSIGSISEENSEGELESELLYQFSIDISDPLDRTHLSFWAMRDTDLSHLVGIGFTNNQSFVLAGLRAYYVVDSGFESEAQNTRDSGLSAQLSFPFIDRGFWNAELDFNYYQDYQLNERKPVSASLNINRLEHYGNSWMYNKAFSLSAYTVDDRDSHIKGASLAMITDLPAEFYIQGSLKHSVTDLSVLDPGQKMGVELQKDSDFINNDPSFFVVPSLTQDIFAKSVTFAQVSVSKVLNLSAYSFAAPISLRREKINVGLSRYQIESPNNQADADINQIFIGADFDVLMLHKFSVNFGLKYIYSNNDNLTERNKFTLGINVPL